MKEGFFIMADKTAETRISPASKNRLAAFACYLIPFLGLGGYLLSLILQGTNFNVTGYYLIHYLYTYDHGFVARGIVGEVISWFFDTVSPEVMRNTVLLFSVLLMVSASLCIGKALNAVKDKPGLFFFTAFTAILICVMPASFRYYYTDIKLDKLLWALTLFSVLLVDKKYGIWLVPFLCIGATLVNPIFLFCSMILISIILLQEFYSKGFSKKNGIICAFSYITMIILGIYALASEKFLGFETPQEMVDYYFSRYGGVLSEEDYHFFTTEWLFDYFEPMEEIIRTSFRIYFVEWGNWKVCLLDLFFLMIPTYTLTGIFWKSCMRSAEDKFQKFIFFLCLISPIVIILPIVFSWESSKYFFNNLIVQLSLMIYFAVSGNGAFINTLNKTFAKIKEHIIPSLLLLTYFTAALII